MRRKAWLARFAVRRRQIRSFWKRLKKKDRSFARVARQFNISRERVRQILTSDD